MTKISGLFLLMAISLCLPVVQAAAQHPQIDALIGLSQKQPDTALLELKKLHAQAVDAGDALTQGLCLQQMGEICYNQGYYALALDFYMQAEKIFVKTGQQNFLAANTNRMGVVYYYNKQIDKARVFYNKALDIYRQTGNEKGIAEILGNIGHLYEKNRQYDSALYYQHSALNFYTRANYKQGTAKIYENLGSIYEDLELYDSAYISFQRSLQLYQEAHNVVSSIEVFNNLGDILRKTGKYEAGIMQTRNAWYLASALGNIYQLASASRDLGKAYQLLHRMDSAYFYAELSRKYSLEIYSKEEVAQTAFLQVLYEIDKKSDEIDHLNTTKEINRILAIAAAIVMALLVVLGLVIFSRQRLKIKEQQALARQREAQHHLMQLELSRQQMEEDNLKQQLEVKGKELSSHALNLIKNQQLLEHLRSTLETMVKEDRRDQKKQIQQIILQINESFNHEQYWKEFMASFEQVHQRFFDHLKQHSSELTKADIRLITLLKINLDSTDIAMLLGISTDSLRVSRYRLRKKLNIPQGENLMAFIQGL